MAATNDLPDLDASKDAVRTFWDRASCGEIYTEGMTGLQALDTQARARYVLEPYLLAFACFADAHDRDVLEIGVGMGADHVELARARPRSLTGIDLTDRAIAFTEQRLLLNKLSSKLHVGDAEALPFADASFDLVYSWGVLHHSPDTAMAIREVWRVLRPGGRARVMIYHKWSIVGFMLWVRYALMTGHPTTSMTEIYANHLESPGTKAFTVDETRQMFAMFSRADVRSQLSFGDLLEGAVGQRHAGMALRVAKAIWPRRLIRTALKRYGLMVMIDAVK